MCFQGMWSYIDLVSLPDTLQCRALHYWPPWDLYCTLSSLSLQTMCICPGSGSAGTLCLVPQFTPVLDNALRSRHGLHSESLDDNILLSHHFRLFVIGEARFSSRGSHVLQRCLVAPRLPYFPTYSLTSRVCPYLP